MNKKAPFLIPLLVLFFGWRYFENLLPALFLMGLAFYIVWVVKSQNFVAFKDSAFKQGGDFTNMLLLLSAAVIKADGRIYEQERSLVRVRLSHDFSPEIVNHYMNNLELYLQKEVLVDQVCRQVRTQLDYPSKIQLFHFLVGLTVTNALIIDSEFELLRKIAQLIDLPERSFVSVLSMFKYERIHSYGQEYKGGGSSAKSNSTSALNNAYAILEITASATNEEIKKAYRKLAKIHHPDRVMHLGVEFQKMAKAKFQKIADAYDLLKTRRGFK